MPDIERSALLPYPARDLYDLVNDVAAYPEFLPWCADVKVFAVDETQMEAAIQIGVSGVRQWFKTRNTMVPGESIDMDLLDGPFRRLRGRWRFISLDPDGCRIALSMSFELKRSLASVMIGPAFTRIANTLVDSFCQRARDLHGD